MKMNWGKGIVITIIAFIGFIMYFVVSMLTDNKYDHDLVTENYYQKELNYQKEINAAKNAELLKEKVTIEKTPEGLKIIFPEQFNQKLLKGKVFLYRPSNKQLDFEIPVSTSKTYLLVPENRLLDGRWNMKIEWQYNGKDYLIKEEFIY